MTTDCTMTTDCMHDDRVCVHGLIYGTTHAYAMACIRIHTYVTWHARVHTCIGRLVHMHAPLRSLASSPSIVFRTGQRAVILKNERRYAVWYLGLPHAQRRCAKAYMSHDIPSRVHAIIAFLGWRPDMEHESRRWHARSSVWEESGRETKHGQAWRLLRSKVVRAVL